jgi:hypothetical protein
MKKKYSLTLWDLNRIRPEKRSDTHFNELLGTNFPKQHQLTVHRLALLGSTGLKEMLLFLWFILRRCPYLWPYSIELLDVAWNG